eukprot:CAMPEP_0198261418 /NCGR_PEP_ID=MMETSP1447-20131203/10144_1 /TAXON_ID=420782 /ORGANISM="Chaetoceros dichaeta, Strain CCMP1751" /LENGTH=573 /DNA_ID=CAMNT_0043949327 /DNA_START=87 /DNA_END=1808 /DNA_ORIENTATION=-
MASEARAMLDALMGSDRDSSIPIGTSTSKGGEGDMWPRGNKKSCYDRDICPLYCAWGVDVFDLFTNTKSDLGQNPYITQEDAREEFLSLPDHEKDRLGYERMLYRKLGDLVRGCDRIVTRNKDKLRAEVAKAARARGAEGNRIDPVTEVKEEVLLETAECMADLELREEEVAKMVERLVQLDHEWKEAWKQLKERHVVKSGEKANHGDTDGKGSELVTEANNESAVNDVNKCELENDLVEDVEVTKNVKLDTEEGTSDQQIVNGEEENEEVKTKVEVNGNDKTRIMEDTSDTYQPENTEIAGKEDIEKKKDETQTEMEKKDETQTEMVALDSDKIEELKSTLYRVSSEQQKLISTLTLITSQNIIPLRENLQGLQKQLYHIRTDTSSDKTVCEISGNFMSSRDAEERIAAHYAGKQYVGWKMVRDKCRELHQKYNSAGRGPQMMSGQQRGASYGSRGGQPGGYGPPGGGHGPPPGNGGHGHGDRGPPMSYQHAPSARHNDRDRRDRSRSRDRDNYSSRSQGGGGRGGNHRSPSRWERDRYPSSSNGGGGHNREYGSGRHGGRRDDRGHNRGRN